MNATETIEYLRSEIESLKAQRAGAVVTVSQADGAIAAYEALIAKLATPTQETMTVEQLSQAIERGAGAD
jgi:hypothetical protein